MNKKLINQSKRFVIVTQFPPEWSQFEGFFFPNMVLTKDDACYERCERELHVTVISLVVSF